MLLSVWICATALTGGDTSYFIAGLSALSAGLFAVTLRKAYQGAKGLDNLLAQEDTPTVPPTIIETILAGLLPFKISKKGVKRLPNIAYGAAGKRNQLDIYVPENNVQPLATTCHPTQHQTVQNWKTLHNLLFENKNR